MKYKRVEQIAPLQVSGEHNNNRSIGASRKVDNFPWDRTMLVYSRSGFSSQFTCILFSIVCLMNFQYFACLTFTYYLTIYLHIHISYIHYFIKNFIANLEKMTSRSSSLVTGLSLHTNRTFSVHNSILQKYCHVDTTLYCVKYFVRILKTKHTLAGKKGSKAQMPSYTGSINTFFYTQIVFFFKFDPNRSDSLWSRVYNA